MEFVTVGILDKVLHGRGSRLLRWKTGLELRVLLKCTWAVS